jgi:hypothetical protein
MKQIARTLCAHKPPILSWPNVLLCEPIKVRRLSIGPEAAIHECPTRPITVAMRGQAHDFDAFECALHALAPTCSHCGIRVLGRGTSVYCCASPARHAGVTDSAIGTKLPRLERRERPQLLDVRQPPEEVARRHANQRGAVKE